MTQAAIEKATAQYTIVYPDDELHLLHTEDFDRAIDALESERERTTKGGVKAYAGTTMIATVHLTRSYEVPVTDDIETFEQLVELARAKDAEASEPEPTKPPAKPVAKPKA